jgi:hypothetical protein
MVTCSASETMSPHLRHACSARGTGSGPDQPFGGRRIEQRRDERQELEDKKAARAAARLVLADTQVAGFTLYQAADSVAEETANPTAASPHSYLERQAWGACRPPRCGRMDESVQRIRPLRPVPGLSPRSRRMVPAYLEGRVQNAGRAVRGRGTKTPTVCRDSVLVPRRPSGKQRLNREATRHIDSSRGALRAYGLGVDRAWPEGRRVGKTMQ